MRINKLLFILVVAALLLPVACNRPEPTPTPTPVPPTPTHTPVPPTSTPAPTQKDPSASVDDLLNRSLAVVEGLTSYRYTVTVRVEGAGIDGTTVESEVVGAVTAEPPAFSVSLEEKTTGEILKIIQIEDRVYVYDSVQEGWIVMRPEVAKFLTAVPMGFDPLATWTRMHQNMVDAATLVDAHEEVEGIDCSHYRVTEDQLVLGMIDPAGPLGGVAPTIEGAQSDYWIANEGGYPVRYVVRVEGQTEDGAEQELVLQADIYDVNAEFGIAPPPTEEIVKDSTERVPAPTLTVPTPEPSGLTVADLPLPEGAQAVFYDDLAAEIPREAADFLRVMGDKVAVYLTDMGVQEANDFYLDAFHADGWALMQIIPLNENLVVLQHQKGSAVATVMLLRQPEDEQTMILLAVEG